MLLGGDSHPVEDLGKQPLLQADRSRWIRLLRSTRREQAPPNVKNSESIRELKE
jgi:hypothetical protein